MAVASTSTSSSLSLKEYLKKYESGADDQKKKKKKKKSEKPNPPGGVLVLDEDPVWAKPVTLEQIEEEDDSAGEEKPQVDEDIEVKRMKRLEAIRSRKPYHGISEDGSGWVSVSEQPTSSDPAAAGGSDLSPPRQRRPRYDTPSPGREEKAPENSDLSPPRQRRRRVDTPSPVHRGREPDSGDLSPPRRRTENISPPRRARNSVLSPPRQRRRRVDTPSPDPQRREQDSGDLSPPRQCRRRVDTPSPEPRRRVQDSGDLSPPRRRPTEDISPPRRARNRPSQAEDLSPPRRGRKDSPDLSPPRNARKGSEASTDLSPPRRKEAASVKVTKRTGLLSAEDIRKENEQKKKEQLLRFATMDPTLTGKGAEAVFRDKDGKRISKEELLKSQEEEKPKEVKLEWGKGLAQKREAEARARELELEKEKPFARTRDDPELDKMLKERIRWGDPMAHLVKWKISEPILEDLGDNEKMKESGFIVPQTIPTHSWLKRGIDFPPNRYGIRPGRHWDGVDRSNGYEKELFKRQNEKRATESEAYLWSVSDM